MACRLPLPPMGSSDAALTSPLVDQSPLATTSPLDTSDGGGAGSARLQPSPWTLVLLAGVGGLLFVVTAAGVFFLVRGIPGRKQAHRAQPKPVSAPVLEGPLLPEGTLLDEGRFLILSVADSLDGLTTYEVKPTVALDICPTCFLALGATVGSSCPRCGRLLPELRPEHPILLASEIRDDESFARVSQLLMRQLSHPAVVTPMSAFVETSFGPIRYFVVVPDVRCRQASQLKTTQRLDEVLTWGISLAEGLAYLHEHAVVLTEVVPESVLLDADAARWRCFGHIALFGDETTGEIRSLSSDNVRGLARILVKLATGRDGIKAAFTLTEPAARVLSQVLRSTGVLKSADFAVALVRARELIHQQQHVSFRIGAHSDVGRLRKLNEDSLLSSDLSPMLTALSMSVGVVAVADGVGGHSAGDVASRLTVEALSRETDILRTEVAEGQPLDAKSWITRAANAANQAVFSEREAMLSDMGSTLVMALLVGRSATVLNVGDSRAYWLTPSGMRQVTTDHSLVQRLIAIGQLTPEEARNHPQKSVIYRVMGDTVKLAYDLFEVSLSPSEALLLCSDGLTDMVEDRVLWYVWHEASSPQAACEELVDLANEAGGYDNITVVIAQLEG
ncbi:MAG: Stp1/IreP family PP2C-type Ser/Thr phosphatase [Anaerolineae bacterium]|nr:Stp1/IreP family PP2C-type Ser/Thr phosphatase [Anaerolineae bacterium]